MIQEIDSEDIELVGLTKRYGSVTVLEDIDLHIPTGSLSVIVGPSGSGKSTMLRLLSGLEMATSGELRIGGRVVTRQSAGERDVGMVFQDYALYPHMTVEANIGFGLKLQARHDRKDGPTRAEIKKRVSEVGELLGLGSLLARKPAQLSGGQRQRVALARAIVRRPKVLLLDEPMSALDAQLRASARTEIVRLHREIGATLVLVTHDQTEALSMATHLIVMDKGRIAQSGKPRELYERPITEFVASFVGYPQINLHSGRDGSYRVGWRPIDASIVEGIPGQSATADPMTGGDLTVSGVVEVCEFTGDAQQLLCEGVSGQFTLVQRMGERWLVPGDCVTAVIPASRLHFFDSNGSRADRSLASVSHAE